MNVNELSSRLERLERENRMMKWVAFAVVGIALAVALIGAATPEVIPNVIEARLFRVIDENGETRAVMSNRGIFYYDENGELRAAMDVDGIVYLDENGKERAVMNVDGIVYLDENGKERAVMNVDGIAHLDENGKTRAVMGVVETVAKRTKKESRYPAGVALFDDDGEVIWMAPN